MTEENSRELRQRTRTLTQNLRSKMRSEELETVERSITAAVERNKLLTTKRPSEFIKQCNASSPLRIAM